MTDCCKRVWRAATPSGGGWFHSMSCPTSKKGSKDFGYSPTRGERPTPRPLTLAEDPISHVLSDIASKTIRLTAKTDECPAHAGQDVWGCTPCSDLADSREGTK